MTAQLFVTVGQCGRLTVCKLDGCTVILMQRCVHHGMACVWGVVELWRMVPCDCGHVECSFPLQQAPLPHQHVQAMH
jgi:hypothetical protein